MVDALDFMFLPLDPKMSTIFIRALYVRNWPLTMKMHPPFALSPDGGVDISTSRFYRRASRACRSLEKWPTAWLL